MAILQKTQEDLATIRRAIEIYDANGDENDLPQLDIHPSVADTPPHLFETPRPNWRKLLAGKTHVNALRFIAGTQENGRIRAADGTKILIEAGLARGKPDFVASQVFRNLKNSKYFTHVAPGWFELNEKPTNPNPDHYILRPLPSHYRLVGDDNTPTAHAQ
jgi:hypothetical protein